MTRFCQADQLRWWTSPSGVPLWAQAAPGHGTSPLPVRCWARGLFGERLAVRCHRNVAPHQPDGDLLLLVLARSVGSSRQEIDTGGCTFTAQWHAQSAGTAQSGSEGTDGRGDGSPGPSAFGGAQLGLPALPDVLQPVLDLLGAQHHVDPRAMPAGDTLRGSAIVEQDGLPRQTR